MSFRLIAALAASALILALPLGAQAQTTVQPVEPVPGQPVQPTDGVITPPSGAPGQPASPTVIEPTTTTPAPTTTESGKPLSNAQDRGLAWLTIGLIALGVVLLGVLIVVLLWRIRGWDPRWLKRWRHSTAEAGWRVGLNGAEIRDFIRLGR
ncbi:MAG: hypothetical protein JHC46_08560 [Solirubrobacteraceae bacterium]|nr:hypothetical protein [Solirubrobacteraceae bacterium]